MKRRIDCEKFLDENYQHYVIEYRGSFKEEISKLDYACGDAITETLGVIAVNQENLDRLRKDVPSIIFIEARSIYVLQQINPSEADSIKTIKINPYLNLTGRGVVVGVIDSGMNYLNQEFIREDNTSRIISIWDQAVQSQEEKDLYIGTEYSNEDINKAIDVYKSGGDPYSIVPSKDKIDHRTKMAGIIGARGYNGEMQGVANDCDFIAVKLLPSPSYKKTLRDNNIPKVPVYSNSEILSAIEYLRRKYYELGRPMIVFFGVGSHEGSHDGYNITARFITSIASKAGIVFASGTGNSGDSEGHITDFVRNVGGISTVELKISKAMKSLNFFIWVGKPDRMSLNIIDPVGEELGFTSPRIYSIESKDFFLIDTNVKVECFDLENFTGHEVFAIDFTNIKEGIWKFQLRGEYITTGRYDIWLPDKTLLPEGTKFLKPNPYNTLTIPYTARRVITVSYYDSINNSILASSGKGFNTNYLINPDIAAPGIDILTTSGIDNKVTTVSGSSAATAIVTGACCILIQWGMIDKRLRNIFSTQLRSALIYGAKREKIYDYPNEDIGYGKLDLEGVFNVFSGIYRNKQEYTEYYVNRLFIRYPTNQIYLEDRDIVNGK